MVPNDEDVIEQIAAWIEQLPTVSKEGNPHKLGSFYDYISLDREELAQCIRARKWERK